MFQRLYNTYMNFLDKYSRPNRMYVKNKIEEEIIVGRHKAILTVEMIFMVVALLNDILYLQDFTMVGFISIASCAIIILVLIASNRTHPEVFKIFSNSISLAFPIILTQHSRSNFFYIWVTSQSFPVFVYCFTGSAFHLTVQAIVQGIYLNTIYSSYLRDMIYETPIDEFVSKFTYAASLCIFFNVIFTGLIHLYLRNAYNQTLKAEKGREESDKQRVFLLGFSHELRNLLNSLIGNLKLASLEKLNDKLGNFIRNSEVCGELLLHLVNNILDSGKVEIGDLEINPTYINVYDMLERTWGVCSELIKRKSLHGRIRIQKDLPRKLNIDHYRLTQILLNLVGNAVKFTDKGSVDVSIEWIGDVEAVSEECFQPFPSSEEDQEEGLFEKAQQTAILEKNLIIMDLNQRKIDQDFIASNSQVDKGILKIVVSDTGSGISSNDIGKLFQKFTQISDDSSKRKLGTGLGLFITKELCKRMNGEIKVFSKLGKGSSFMLCIPITSCPKERREQKANSYILTQLQPTKYQRVLTVDDDPLSSLIVGQFLNKLGVETVELAADGLEGYLKFFEFNQKQLGFNIVTMDIEMPKMNGKKAAEKIREYEKINKLKPCILIMISGNCGEAEIEECMNENGSIRANAFLKKPITLEDLKRTIYRQISYTL